MSSKLGEILLCYPNQPNQINVGLANKRFDSQLSDVQFRLSGITRPIDHFIHQLLQDGNVSMADALDFTRICNRSCWSGMWTDDEMNLRINHIESLVLWKQLQLPHLQEYSQKMYCDNTTTMEYVCQKVWRTRSPPLMILAGKIWNLRLRTKTCL
jgi:hypothetical protein